MFHGSKRKMRKINCKPTTSNLISDFRSVLNVVFFLLGDSMASSFFMPTFRNTPIFIGRLNKNLFV